jgi:hypothetical protein
MKTKTTERERVILSGLFALLNLGVQTPKDIERKLGTAFVMKKLTVDSATHLFCAEYCENDEMFEMFCGEADHWYKRTFSKAKMTREEITRIWKETAIVFKMSDETAVVS